MGIASNLLLLLSFSLMLGCGSDVGNFATGGSSDGHDQNPNEIITTLKLVFSPAHGGDSFSVTWADPELDGDPTVEDITIRPNQDYTVTFHVFNELEEPTEDVTIEITDEMDEHQVFFSGSAVQGPCNTENPHAILDHRYTDLDNYGAPIGLTNAFTSRAAGTGILSVLLRHMPKVNDRPLKTNDLAAVMDTDGLTALPGSTDINVNFNVIVE